jgi:hypothetical protein
MSEPIQSIRGMSDVLPDQAPLWEFFEDTVRDWLRLYGYRAIRTPLVEKQIPGRIIAILSKNAYKGTAKSAAYSAAKAGVEDECLAPDRHSQEHMRARRRGMGRR